MFRPKYDVTNKIVLNIHEIGEVIGVLNTRRFSRLVLVKMEREAAALSAHSSTSIEGNPLRLTSVKQLLKKKPEKIAESQREVLNYNDALKSLNASLRRKKIRLTDGLITGVQRRVVKGLVHGYDCGHYRKTAVFVNDTLKRVTIYWPPDWQDVPQLMKELETFVNKNVGTIDPLILAGLFHKQFAIIYPFIDGNGRTARLVTKTILARLGIDTFKLFSFENYYDQHLSDYFQLVGALGNYYDISDGIDYTDWLEFFTDGILNELNRVLTALQNQQPRTMKTLGKIFDYIDEHGSITMSEYAQITDRKRATRIKDFKRLVEQDLLDRAGRGRATYYRVK